MKNFLSSMFGRTSTVADTSIQAHTELLKSGTINLQQKQILDVITTPMTSREICNATGLERSSVTGRLNSLCIRRLAYEYDYVICKVSGRNVHRYKVSTLIGK